MPDFRMDQRRIDRIRQLTLIMELLAKIRNSEKKYMIKSGRTTGDPHGRFMSDVTRILNHNLLDLVRMTLMVHVVKEPWLVIETVITYDLFTDVPAVRRAMIDGIVSDEVFLHCHPFEGGIQETVVSWACRTEEDAVALGMVLQSARGEMECDLEGDA